MVYPPTVRQSNITTTTKFSISTKMAGWTKKQVTHKTTHKNILIYRFREQN